MRTTLSPYSQAFHIVSQVGPKANMKEISSKTPVRPYEELLPYEGRFLKNGSAPCRRRDVASLGPVRSPRVFSSSSGEGGRRLELDSFFYHSGHLEFHESRSERLTAFHFIFSRRCAVPDLEFLRRTRSEHKLHRVRSP